MQVITLNKIKPSLTLPINKEQPFIAITQIRIPTFTPQTKEIASILSDLDLYVHLYSDNNLEQSYPIGLGTFLVSNIDKPIMNWIKYEQTLYTIGDHNEIMLELDDYSQFDFDIELELTFFKDRISINDPWDEFRIHIEETNNINILFSAPFGHGKTSFLNEFFRQNSLKYEVFKIYPVNFSVATNDDIFKYIKAEIFFQLLRNEKIDFDKRDVSHFQNAPQFIIKNASYILGPFLKELPLIGRSVIDVYDRLNELKKKYFEEVKSKAIDEKKQAKEFIQEFYEKEGSIYEVNFYTHLIRILLNKHSKKWNKQNVLVIDDLDRMDPEHIFRILNVLSAHFDSPEYRIETGLPNKFGFQKIIIVGDYSNLNKIFAHRYGPNTDYGGYINKYYSKKVFEYDNKKAIGIIIQNIEKIHQSRSIVVKILTFVMRDLLESDNLSLREIIKWKNAVELNAISSKNKNYAIFFRDDLITINTNYTNSMLVLFQVIYLLLKIWDENILIKKLESCRGKSDGKNFRRSGFSFEEITGAGLLILAKETQFKNKSQHRITFRQRILVVHIEEASDAIGYDYFKSASTIEVSKGERYEELIYPSTFYEVLIMNVEKYKSTGGLGDV